MGGGGGKGGIGGWKIGDDMGLVLAPRTQAGPISWVGGGSTVGAGGGGGLGVGEEVGASWFVVDARRKIVAISL